MRKVINLLQEFSIPLIAGVIVALIVANVDLQLYHAIVKTPFTQWKKVILEGGYKHHSDASHDEQAGEEHASATEDRVAVPAPEGEGEHAETMNPPAEGEEAAAAAGEHAEEGSSSGEHESEHGEGEHPWWEHFLTLHFLIDDIFMVFFFGIAAKEITESCLPGGALNPIKNAINPLFGTIGGVLGPVGMFLLLNSMMGKTGSLAAGGWTNGWGIPTATDIALAWLVARIVFGKGHSAVSYLLLLAVADDAIGLGIIAFAYPDPMHPTVWANTIWILPGMGIAYALRKMNVHSWLPYVLLGGAFSWWGLYSAHLHPALALVLIVPFLPGPKRDLGMFDEEADYDEQEKDAKAHGHHGHSPLENFEHNLKLFVDFGLFFFAFANAGVAFSGINNLTWIILLSLLVGKTVGIAGFAWVGNLLGFAYPAGMKFKHLVVAGTVAGIGLTVALFVSAQAFTDVSTQGAAKMGALFSGGIALISIVLGKMLRVKDSPESGEG